jgi:hypothetical protein
MMQSDGEAFSPVVITSAATSIGSDADLMMTRDAHSQLGMSEGTARMPSTRKRLGQ